MRFFIKTFGCQMNVSDSEKIRHILQSKGFSEAVDETGAELIVVNTCAVRQKPEEKIYSYAGRLAGDKIVIVTGCVAQTAKDAIVRKHPRIAAVLGTNDFYHIGAIIDEYLARPHAIVKTSFSRQWNEWVPALAARDSRVSAYVSIMEGCNNFCSYCIVPFTRGREKMRPVQAIMAEVQALAAQGFQELILLGQNVNHWRDDAAQMDFPDLLGRIAQTCAIPWIRFVTSYPGAFAGRLAEVVAAHRRIARHIHFPAQSGSSRVLRLMNREYNRADYVQAIRSFRRLVPDMAFSSDFIVGFPGETERDFELTLSLLEQVHFTSIFSFLYSPRPFTRAQQMTETLTLAQKKERLYQVQAAQAALQLQHNRALIGSNIDVLLTGPHTKKKGDMIGRSEDYRVVNIATAKPAGSFVRVRISGAGPHSLRGEEA